MKPDHDLRFESSCQGSLVVAPGRAQAMKTVPLCLVSCLLARDVAARNPLVIVPGLTGSALEVQEEDAPMPHALCKRNTKDQWMQVWVSPAPQLHAQFAVPSHVLLQEARAFWATFRHPESPIERNQP